MPYSGPVSSLSTIGKVQAAYFRMVNERGGVNGRKINLISYDDAYNPVKTIEQVRKLIESDEVLLIFQMLGTVPNAAAQKYLNQKKVPQLLASSGADRFSNYKEYPWTMGFNASYQSEGHIFARYILDNHPNAKIAVIYQNGDYGKDYLKGLKDGLGKKASMVVAEAGYEVIDPTIDSQMVMLKSSGADVLLNASTPKFASQAIKKAAELGWKPVHILSGGSVSVSEVLPAGRHREFQGHHQRLRPQFFEEPDRSAMAGRSRHEAIFQLHGKILSGGRKALALQLLWLCSRPDDGAYPCQVWRQPHARQCDEGGDKSQ